MTNVLQKHASKILQLPVSVVDLAQRFARRPSREVAAFLKVEARTKAAVPLVGFNVAAGFPSPADDYLDRPLDCNELLMANRAAIFAVRIGSDSMIEAGIFPGDIAFVDRSQTPKDRSIIVAVVNQEFVVKRYRRRNGKIWLASENSAYKDIPITEDMTFEIVGVIHHSVRVF